MDLIDDDLKVFKDFKDLKVIYEYQIDFIR